MRVPRARGEGTRLALRERGLLRSDLEVGHEGELLLFPIADDVPAPEGLGDVVDAEFVRSASRGPQDYRDLLDWPASERTDLPRSFDVVGDIVLIRLPPEVEPRGPEIGAALLRFVPGARLVGQDRGVQGPERRRRVERLAGSGPWTTRHRENGLELEVDLEGAYFSPRLAREHARVASEVGPGDRVYDLCCGVGPFAVTIARDGRASQIVAVDANPVAVDRLRATLARRPFGARVEVVEERLEQFVVGRTPFERVVFNLPHEGIKYLPSVGNLVSRAGRLFFYEVAERGDRSGRAIALVEALGGSSRWRRVESRTVHPYSPTADLVAYTFERTDP
ncbi:MAG TPA: methyltransferase domain-containing protein [Thermoplasmata archaeon]|nr:methyltransferase domain-containing protein [Thermoplasmata archaeon]